MAAALTPEQQQAFEETAGWNGRLSPNAQVTVVDVGARWTIGETSAPPGSGPTC